jgi:signal transduction histidine kinase
VIRNMSLLLTIWLVPALEWQARGFRRTGLRAGHGDEMSELPDEHKTCIYRVVQEALHIARAMQARNATVEAPPKSCSPSKTMGMA